MNNIIPTKNQLVENFNNALDSIRSEPEYVEICEEIRLRLTNNSHKANRDQIRIKVPYRYHSVMRVDLSEANLNYSTVFEDFEISF